MRASVLYDVRRMEVREVPRPAAGPHDVLVRVEAVGLCGTDFHIFSGEANYHTDRRGMPIPLARHPQILGHEIVGRVEEVDEGMSALRPGARVLMDQGLNCRSTRRTPPCEYCATGDSHQCEEYEEHGITGPPGGLAEYIALPAINAVPIRSAVDPAAAALSEPLGCIVHACDLALRARNRYTLGGGEFASPAQTVLIFGAGTAGQLFVQYLRQALRFDGRILVSEPDAGKRAVVNRYGAETIDPGADDVIEAVQEITGGRRAEWIIDASGAAGVFETMPGVMRKQATVMLYGHGHGGADLSVLNRVQYLEPVLLSPVGASGGFDADGRPATYRRALDLIERGEIDVAPLITHRYTSLDSVPAAFAGDHLQPGYLKGVVTL